MLLRTIAFYIFAVPAVVCAALAVTRRNIVHSAAYLTATLVLTAGIFLQLAASFLFAAQILLSASATMALFFFVILPSRGGLRSRAMPSKWRTFLPLTLALFFAVLGFFAAWAGRGTLPMPAADGPSQGNTEAIGGAIFEHYLLPFEMTAVLLLVAIVAAVIMAKRRVE